MAGESRGGDNKGRYFLLGVVLGGLVGAGVAIWVVESKRLRFGQQSGGVGGRVAEFISVIRDEFIPGLREAVREGMEQTRTGEHGPSKREEPQGGVGT
ncbi:MAG: hypothetical protein ACOC58_01865 [Chloroflexota bacterium]